MVILMNKIKKTCLHDLTSWQKQFPAVHLSVKTCKNRQYIFIFLRFIPFYNSTNFKTIHIFQNFINNLAFFMKKIYKHYTAAFNTHAIEFIQYLQKHSFSGKVKYVVK